MPDLAQIIRAEIIRRELSAKGLARETGLPQTTISAFLRGADMRGGSLSVLCRYLGLELRLRRARKAMRPVLG